MAELLGRLYKTKEYDKMNFFCSNGTIIHYVGKSFLISFLYNFKTPDNFKGDPKKTSASLTGEYKNMPFSMGISLDNGIITLSCRKSLMVDYEELEQILGLI